MSDNNTTIQNVIKDIKELTEVTSKVFKLDNSLTKLSKNSGLTANELKKITNEAYKLGNNVAKSGSQVLELAAMIKSTGYNISDSMQYAEDALMTTNISGNIKDAEQAASNLISIMKDFKNETPEFAGKINDSISAVTNTGIIDFDNLIDGSTKLSAAANQAGMSFEQMLGTLAGAYEILGDMNKTVTGQAEIFSRLQGISTDGIESSSVSRLQEIFSDSTNGAVNIIDQKTNQLRNVYDILDDLNSVWNTLSTNTQEALALEAAGAGYENVFLALMENWKNVEKAVRSATNSIGSAEAQNKKHLESLSGSTEKFQASLERLSTTVVNSELLKFFIDLGTTGLSAINKLSDSINPLLISLGGLTSFFGRGISKQRFCPVWM